MQLGKSVVSSIRFETGPMANFSGCKIDGESYKLEKKLMGLFVMMVMVC